LEKEVKGLKMHFIPKIKIGRISIAVIWYLIKNAKSIDVLHLFHHREPTYIYSIIYKKLNPLGHVYIKSDKGHSDIVKNNGFFSSKKRHQKRERLFEKALVYIDTISVENIDSYYFLIEKYKKYKNKFVYLTNALDIDNFYKQVPIVPYEDKKNIILTVGRIGAKEKNNQMLLDAISKVELKDWKMIFIGPIEKEFENNIKEFYLNNATYRENVEFKGAVYDRKKLLEYYSSAKLFCLTSIEESFGFVLIEAMSYGLYVITTDVSSAKDITDNEKYGEIVYCEEDLIEAINKMIHDEKNYKELSSEIISYTRKKYNWNIVIETLFQRLI
jgi:glycosyltransferase involved in cell wall biosynthesis